MLFVQYLNSISSSFLLVAILDTVDGVQYKQPRGQYAVTTITYLPTPHPPKRALRDEEKKIQIQRIYGYLF